MWSSFFFFLVLLLHTTHRCEAKVAPTSCLGTLRSSTFSLLCKLLFILCFTSSTAQGGKLRLAGAGGRGRNQPGITPPEPCSLPLSPLNVCPLSPTHPQSKAVCKVQTGFLYQRIVIFKKLRHISCFRVKSGFHVKVTHG